MRGIAVFQGRVFLKCASVSSTLPVPGSRSPRCRCRSPYFPTHLQYTLGHVEVTQSDPRLARSSRGKASSMRKHVEEVDDDDDSDEGPQIASSSRRRIPLGGQGLGRGLGPAASSTEGRNSATKKQASTQKSAPAHMDGSDSDGPPPLASDEESDEPPPLLEPEEGEDDDDDPPPLVEDEDSSSSGSGPPDLAVSSGEWGRRMGMGWGSGSVGTQRGRMRASECMHGSPGAS